jgi:hypothetical protein
MFRTIRTACFCTALAVCLFATAAQAATTASRTDEPMGTSHASTTAISVRVQTKPAPGGVLVHAITSGYRFAPEHLSPIHGQGRVVQGEGHGHIYVDGATKPKTMIVGPWTYLGLTPGTHTIRVTLNANDHNEWTWKDKVVASSIRVTVPKESM